MEFTVVGDEFRQIVPNRGGAKPNPAFAELEKGLTLYLETEPKHIQGWYEAARKRGFKMTARKIAKDKFKGVVVWWDKNIVTEAK